MKIGVVYLGSYPPIKGGSGADRRVRDMVRGLAAQPNVDVTMFVPGEAGRLENTAIHDGIRIQYFSKRGKTSVGKILSRLSFWSALAQAIRRQKFDWFFFYSTQADALPIMIWLRHKGVNLAAEFCDLRSVGLETTDLKSRLMNAFWKIDEAYVPRLSDLNFVISKELARHVSQRAPDTPVAIIPILVDEDLFALLPNFKESFERRFGVKAENFVVTYAGGLSRYEGVGVLLKAFATIAARHPSARLIIAGRLVSNDENYDDVEKLTRELNIANAVLLPGWVSTDDVKLIYSRSDVLVLPQIPHAFNSAALPTKLAEYSAMGKPIIATEIGDVSDYFVDGTNALLVPGGNVDALSTAIEKLITSYDLRNTLGKGAKVLASGTFSYKKAGTMMVSKMRDLQRGNHTPQR